MSKQIWIRYNLPELKQSPNRFSRAIIKYGADAFGFAVQENIVFTRALEGREFINYGRDGVLWKDSFAPSHGEFSHSLQWFAAGQAPSERGQPLFDPAMMTLPPYGIATASARRAGSPRRRASGSTS